MPINLPFIDISFYFVVYFIASYLNNMAISCLLKNFIFDNSNLTRAHIAQLVEQFHGKEEVACSIRAVGTNNYTFFDAFSSLTTLSEIDSSNPYQMGKHKCFNGICPLLPIA